MFAELASMDDLYNQVKTIRRTLRSLGFAPGGSEGTNSVLLTEQQAGGFLEQMRILNQVSLVRYKLKLFRRTGLLGSAAPGVVDLVEDVEIYLNLVLALWQHQGSSIGGETPLAVVSQGLAPLLRTQEFRQGIAVPMDGIWILISEEAFGKPTKRL